MTELPRQAIDDILDYLCRIATKHAVFYLWRPYLRDPKDDMLLELAVASESRYLVTFNVKDFAGVDCFGIEVCRPREFLTRIGELE